MAIAHEDNNLVCILIDVPHQAHLQTAFLGILLVDTLF